MPLVAFHPLILSIFLFVMFFFSRSIAFVAWSPSLYMIFAWFLEILVFQYHNISTLFAFLSFKLCAEIVLCQKQLVILISSLSFSTQFEMILFFVHPIYSLKSFIAMSTSFLSLFTRLLFCRASVLALISLAMVLMATLWVYPIVAVPAMVLNLALFAGINSHRAIFFTLCSSFPIYPSAIH